jgi:site-specific DNA-methyltransferase (adenine-specific)
MGFKVFVFDFALHVTTATMMTMLPIPVLATKLGRLFEGDCLSILPGLPAESVDLAFADPPFNLNKAYSSKVDDNLADGDYLLWCQTWLVEMIRVLKPGGSLFLYNIPKWNLPLGAFLMQHLTFRHWVTVDIKFSLPIQKRLYPSNYSLLYFVKGKSPAIFHPDRLPIDCCRHCGGEQRDYGGYKDKMNPLGVSLTDVWTDIPPVRHSKYKNRDANELSLKLMDRVISMSSDPGSVVLDPFGGAGTTFVAAEMLDRQWIGTELDCSAIQTRFVCLDEEREYLAKIHGGKNRLFTDTSLKLRGRYGHRTDRYRVDPLVQTSELQLVLQ